MDNTNKRITKNTLYLTVRMILLMLISFYTSRVVLEKLGVEDYGIYNVVASFAVTFAFFTSALTNATQRFITIELGKDDVPNANKVFNQHLIVYGIISAFVILVAEVVGTYYINNGLNIPPGRIFAAHWAFHFSIASIIVGLLAIPYEALFVAHEEMSVYSYVSVWEGVFKLIIVYLLNISTFDNLILYSFLVFFVCLTCKAYYVLYSHRKYAECYLKWCYDKKIIKDTFKFVGWSFISAGQISLCDQGISIILNAFLGPIANAARGLTSQISGVVFKFINNLLIAFQPQIVKSYAKQESDYLSMLFMNSSRFCFFILWLLACPILFCVDGLMRVWLVEVPRWTCEMVQLNLIASLFYVLTKPIWTIVVASGDLKKYTLLTSIISFSSFPLSCIALFIGCDAPSVYMVSIVVDIISLIVQLKLLKQYLAYRTKDYITLVIQPILILLVVTTVPSLLIANINSGTAKDSLIYFIVIFLLVAISILLVGLTKKEKLLVLNKCISILRH